MPPSTGNRHPVMLVIDGEASMTATLATSATVLGRSSTEQVKRVWGRLVQGPREDRVHGNALRADLVRHGLHEAGDGVPRRHEVRRARLRELPFRRRHDDDPAALPGDHVPQRGPDSPEHVVEVPGRFDCRHWSSVTSATGSVFGDPPALSTMHVEPAEAVDGEVDQALHRPLLADVAAVEGQPVAGADRLAAARPFFCAALTRRSHPPAGTHRRCRGRCLASRP